MQAHEYAGAGFGQARRALESFQPRATEVLHVLLDNVPVGRRGETLVADFGCCDGGFVHALHQAGFRAAGLDLPAVIERARRETCRACRLVPLNIELAPVAEMLAALRGRPAFVYMSEVIEHVVRDFELLVKVRDLLEPGGRFFVSTPATPEKIYERDHLRYYPLASLARLMELAGFEPFSLGVMGHQNYFVGRKPNAI